ncbi:hypothetical protein [Alloscardovia criceti]|uniref:hypothetical protein n=1 Tax=Alloscardovia criceti TaxID=356828 RepID=UPI00036688D1|nr:hypothetical protein [Alloscardovia criceti]
MVDTRAGLSSIMDDEDPKQKPLSEGTVLMPTVLPKLTARQLAYVDTIMEATTDGSLNAVGIDRRLKKAQKDTMKQMDADHRLLMKALHQKKTTVAHSEELATSRSIAQRYGWGTGFITRAKSTIPWHSTSISSSGVLNR